MTERCLALVGAVLALAAVLPGPVLASAVVGTGAPASCTEAVLNTAMGCGAPSGLPAVSTCTGGGTITFNCGASPVTITVTSQKTIAVDTSIDGGNLITLSGGGATRVLSVNSGVTLALTDLTISNGFGVGDSSGGAVANGGTLSVINVTLARNVAFNGGALYNGAGTLSVTNSTFSSNGAFHGGAILNSVGSVTVTNSTFSSNNAANSSSSLGRGGAIYNGGALSVTNSTFSGNSAYNGGAIATVIGYNATLTVTNSTFARNSAQTGGAISSNGGTVTLSNTIVADSTAGGNCSGSSTIIDQGHNLDSGTSCGFTSTTGSLSNIDPLLDPAGLARHGGPTQTIALQAGSPAINAGNEPVCAAPPVNDLDQRGFPRPGTGATTCSIGAYEYWLPGCCQCPASCAVPVDGSCGDCTAVFGAACTSGALCVLHTPTPTATITPTLTPTITPTPTSTMTPTSTPTRSATATNTPGANDCCQCADFCAAPIVGTCGGCPVVFGASCTEDGLCISRTPPPATPTPTPTQTRTTTVTPALTATQTVTHTPTNTPSATVTHTSTSTPPQTAPVTPTATPTPKLTATRTPTETRTSTPTPPPCSGDCDGREMVTVDELLTLVNIALGNAPLTWCDSGDADRDNHITVDEILTAVNHALNGCPSRICGGIAGLPCGTDEVCDLRDSTCLIADLTGTCVPRPGACPEIYDPVCGCDAVTYSNECFRLAAGTTLAHVEECR